MARTGFEAGEVNQIPRDLECVEAISKRRMPVRWTTR